MIKFGEILQEKREKKGLTIKEVSKELNIDGSIISKIENGKRIATRKQVLAFVNLYNIGEELAFSSWLSEKIIEYVKDEAFGLKALKVAEEKVKYVNVKSSSYFPDDLNDLLKQLDKLQNEWQLCKPLNGTQLRKMREYFDVTYTYDSNKIEGNTLTYQETHLIVNEGVTIGGKSMREHLEAINHYEAIDFIVDIAQKNESITERLIKEVHYLILKGIDRANAGVYRSVPVLISGSSFKPPEPFLVAKQMEEVMEFYMDNKNKLHPVILAADMHEKIVTVHPFIDGNGRTSRLIMNLILIMNGFTIASLKGDYDSRMQYYKALNEAQVKGNKELFYKLIAETCVSSLEEHIQLAG